MSKKLTDKLEVAMRFVYGHFLEEGETLEEFMRSRKAPRPNVRHLTRRALYEQSGCTYRQLGRAEAAINGGRVTDSSTMTHSLHVSPQKFGDYGKAEQVIRSLVELFEARWMELRSRSGSPRLAHYYQMPHHVLAVVVSFAESFGWVDPSALDGLAREFSALSPEFVEREIESTETK